MHMLNLLLHMALMTANVVTLKNGGVVLMAHVRITYRMLMIVVAILLVTFPLEGQAADLGTINFPTSGDPEAQRHFINGALLLHSFEYRDARKAFRTAQELEPDFAMAYWGEALTHYHPIWGQWDREAAQSVLKRLAASPKARLAKAPTEREKAYLQTVEVLFLEGDKSDRLFAYMQAMEAFSNRYPEDAEAASLHALSILGTAQGQRDYRVYIRAGAIALRVFEKHPRHPGAAHYVIHAFDDPIHAPLGLKAARSYADIAPDAPHALHMPSHMFMALGMWDESVSSNEASMQAARNKGQSGLHAAHWLVYSYLQQGRYQKTAALIKELEERTGGKPNKRHRAHLAYMRSAYVVETRQWDSEFYDDTKDLETFGLRASANILFTKGMRALKTGNIGDAERTLTQLKGLPESTASKRDAGLLPVVINALEASIQLAKGNAERAIKSIEKAVATQESLSVEFGPPRTVKPVHALYGEMLLDLGRPQDAVTMYRKAIDHGPRRALSLLGLARAAMAIGDTATSTKAYAELKLVRRQADASLSERQEVERNLSGLTH